MIRGKNLELSSDLDSYPRLGQCEIPSGDLNDLTINQN